MDFSTPTLFSRQPSVALLSTLQGVLVSGDPAVIVPASYLGDLECVLQHVHMRGLRVAGVPMGGLTILPEIPLGDDELLNVCLEYCHASNDMERAAVRQKVYLQEYPKFYRNPLSRKAMYHPGDYIAKIAHLCWSAMAIPEDDILFAVAHSPYLQISPIKEICARLRSQIPHTSFRNDGFFHGNSLRDGVDSHQLLEPLMGSSSPSSDYSRTLATNLFPHAHTVEITDTEESVVASDLTGKEVVDKTEQPVSEYFNEEDFEVITQASVYYDGDGEGKRLAAVFIPNGVSPECCRAAARVLEPAATKKNLRASTNGGVPPDTGIVGYYDYINSPVQRKCRETEFMRNNWNAVMDNCAAFFQTLDKLYSRYAPVHYGLQSIAIPVQYRLCDTVFSTVTVNRNFRTAVHKDTGDFRGGLGVLCVVGGKYDGCHLAIRRIKKAFRLRVGDVLLFDTSLEHGNTEVRNPEHCWYRTSVVCYLRNGLMSSVCVMEQRKHLNRLLADQLHNVQVHDATINLNGADERLPPLYVPKRLISVLAPVQLAALGFIIERTEKGSGCVVAMTMGLGKTLVALSLSYSYLHIHSTADVLILAPKPIISHWAEEYVKWESYGLCFQNFVASDGLNQPAFEAQLMRYAQQLGGATAKTGHVFVLNPEYITSFLRRFKGFRPRLIIVDEGHRVASRGTKLIDLLERLRCPLRIVLSGTPLQNDATELYRVVEWVNRGVTHVFPQRHFHDLAAGINRYIEGDDEAFGDALAAQQYLQDWMKGFVFRELESDLPPLHDYLLVCGSSATQRALEEKAQLSCVGDQVLRVCEHRPFHLSTHPVCYLAFVSGAYLSMAGSSARRDPEGSSAEAQGKVHLTEHEMECLARCYSLIQTEALDKFVCLSGKMVALVQIMKMIQAKREKAIIFSQYVGTQDFIHRVCTAFHLPVFTVRGRDSHDRRRLVMEQFRNDSELLCLVLSTKIAAYGLDFTVANHVVLFDSWWNPQVDLQAIARAYRRNQRKPVVVYRLASEREDKTILRAQTRKMALFRCIMHEKTSRAARPEEVVDCSEREPDLPRKALWRDLKQTVLEGGQLAVCNIFAYGDTVKDSIKPERVA